MNRKTHTPRIRRRRIAAMLLAVPALVAGSLVVAAPAYADDSAQWVTLAYATDVVGQHLGIAGYGPTQQYSYYAAINACSLTGGGCTQYGFAPGSPDGSPPLHPCIALALPPGFGGGGGYFIGYGDNTLEAVWSALQQGQSSGASEQAAVGCASPAGLVSNYSGMCLQPVNPWSSNAGDAIVQRTCDGTVSQQWTSKQAHHGYNLVNKLNNLCLDARGGPANGTPIEQWPCAADNGISNQFWGYGGGSVLQSGVNPDPWKYCIATPGYQDGQQVELQACDGQPNAPIPTPQTWLHP